MFDTTVSMAGKTMRAVQYSAYGGGAAALKHVEIEVPSPKKDELLVKVEAASLNPLDCKIQNGVMRPIVPAKFPYVPGTDIAGEIVEVGTGSEGFKPGDKVVSWLSLRKSGGLAEYAIAPLNTTAQRPTEVSAAQGAGLPIAALTALRALKQISINFNGTGDPANVLVTAASGGVGTYAVQLARLANLHVTATCGARNIGLVKSLGADEVLDYKTPEGKNLKSPSGRKYDLVIHCTTGIAWSTFEPNLAAEGKVVDLTPGPQSYFRTALNKLTFAKKKLVPLIAWPNREDLKFFIDLVKEGKITTVIDSTHPLSKAEEAWAKSTEGHANGKIIVEI